MDEDLKERIKDLEILHAQRSEVMRKMAHDMRSPLSAVKSYADMMLMFADEPTEVREKFLQIIIQASDKLSSLIDELQNLAHEKIV